MPDPLDLRTRRRVFLLVSQSPGVTESEVVRRSGLNRGTVRYQLECLERRELVVCSQEGKFRHYFPRDKLPSAQRTVLKSIMRSVPRSLVVYVLLFPGVGFGQITEEFDLAPSTISYHLSRLVRSGVIERERRGAQTHFRLKDPETVLDVLVTFQESYLANLRDRWASRLEAMRGRDRKGG